MAAGQSLRFGMRNKLLTPLNGKPLILHAAAILSQIDVAHKIAVVADPDVAALLQGFGLIDTENSRSDMAHNIGRGVQAALDLGARRVVIMLGDMPFVTAGHVHAVMARCTDVTAAASGEGAFRSPPACFPSQDFARLLGLCGDAGASQILKNLPDDCVVQAPTGMLRDIDRPADLSSR
jgi:molybdenum cofactor cytidylyltransferase